MWQVAVEADGIRDGAWAAEITGLVDLALWLVGSRVIVRRERPHPGAQLSLFDDTEGFRYTAFITDTPRRVFPGQLGGLELRHRQHARARTASAKPKQPG